jgi:hypothetical protein
MRTVFSSWAYGESGADLDRAEGTLVFALLAGIVPALLAWLLAGVGVLVLIVPVYAGLAIAQHRRAHGLAPELSAWALAEVYVASALAALVGFLWLT